MEQGPANVVTLDSDSENELEIISESIPNYGNYSTPVQIAPELQQKIKHSLEKRGSLPGKIKNIKVYATKMHSQVMGSVTASLRPPGGGQPTKIINVGASINDLFSNQVRSGGNNNSKKPKIATPSDAAKRMQAVQKRSDQPLPVGVDEQVSQRPTTPNSPVILYSPIRKGKTAKMKDSLDGALPTLGFQQTVVHLPQNPSPSTPSLVPCKKIISQNLNGENVSLESSKTDSEDFQKYDLSLCDLGLNSSDKVFKNVCAKVNPVELSPVRFSSDDDELSVEDSILSIWNSPVPSPKKHVNSLLDLKQNSSFGKVNGKDCVHVSEISKELVVNEETMQNMPMHLVKEMWKKMNEDEDISKRKKETKMNPEEESNLENLFNQDEHDYNDERENNNEEHCSEKENSNNKFAMSKYVKINVETLPKRLLGSSVLNNENDSFLDMRSDRDVRDPSLWSTNDDRDPPLWSTIFPPSPPSPPPESWVSSSALWELDAGGFEAITGLCGHQTANEFKRNLNSHKPLVRVLRKRHKN